MNKSSKNHLQTYNNKSKTTKNNKINSTNLKKFNLQQTTNLVLI